MEYENVSNKNRNVDAVGVFLMEWSSFELATLVEITRIKEKNQKITASVYDAFSSLSVSFMKSRFN